MPELPDVEAFKHYLDAISLHTSIVKTSVHDERILSGTSPQQLGRRLKHATLDGSRRHGKYLFAHISKSSWLLLHFGMTGALAYSGTEGELPRHTRVSLDFENGGRLAFVCQRLLGKLEVIDGVDAYIEDQGLGPDALDERLTPEWLFEQLSSRRGSLKSGLMNQSLMAGIGNVYSDEILFHAKVHPGIPCNELSRKQVAHLLRVMQRVLRTAARHNADVERFPSSYLTRKREKGARCPRCESVLKTSALSGRTAYFCPACQKEK